MRNLFLSAAIAVSLSLAFTACKTTEENYQRAYDIAKAKKTEGLTAEEIAGFNREAAMPKTVYNGDSIPLRPMYVKGVADANGAAARRYNVIVASFKQRFNAMSVFNRLKDGGYPGALILSDKDQRYYVGAFSTDTLPSAIATMQALSASSPLTITPGFPYILEKVR